MPQVSSRSKPVNQRGLRGDQHSNSLFPLEARVIGDAELGAVASTRWSFNWWSGSDSSNQRGLLLAFDTVAPAVPPLASTRRHRGIC